MTHNHLNLCPVWGDFFMLPTCMEKLENLQDPTKYVSYSIRLTYLVGFSFLSFCTKE